MKSQDVIEYITSLEKEETYDIMEKCIAHIDALETASGNMVKIIMCMAETQFCNMICNHPAVGNEVHIEMMRRIYRAINHYYGGQFAAIVRNASSSAPDTPNSSTDSQLN